MEIKSKRNQLLVNILVFAISLLLTDKFAEYAAKLFPLFPWAKIATYIGLAIAILILILLIVIIYLYDAYLAYVKENKELAENQVKAERRDKIRQAIPSHITVSSREDVLEILENGDGILYWSFRIRVNDAEKCETLDLHVVSEHVSKLTPSETNFPSNIIINKICVARHEVPDPQSYYTLHEIRFPDVPESQRKPMEFGILRIPLNFDDLNVATEIPVEVKLVMKQTFTSVNSPTGDFFVVDIPQLTENLKVEIKSSDPQLSIQSASHPHVKKLSVAMGYLGTEDPSEVIFQKEKVKQSENKLIWQTTFPKLGYHYRVSFRLVRPGQSTPPSQPSRENSSANSGG